MTSGSGCKVVVDVVPSSFVKNTCPPPELSQSLAVIIISPFFETVINPHCESS